MSTDHQSHADQELKRVELGEEHSAIRTVMHWIERELARQLESSDGITADGPLLGPLRSFHEQLAAHFEFEETSGLLPLAITMLGNTDPSLKEWESQHRELLLRLRGSIHVLEQAAKTHAPLARSFASDLREFFDDLRRHDAVENRILGAHRSGDFRAAQNAPHASPD